MSITLPCVCGRELQLATSQAGTSVRCPGCGNAVQVPAMGIAVNDSPRQQRPGNINQHVPLRGASWPWLLAGLGLVIIASVATLFLLGRNPTTEAVRVAEVQPPAKQAKEPARGENPAAKDTIPPKPMIVEQPLPPPDEPPARQKEEAKETLPPKPPTIAIERVEPVKPMSGDSLTIYLTSQGADGKPAEAQYRTTAEEDWKTAEQGIVKIARLSGPALVLEFRAVDKRGTASPVLAKTWKIEPLNLVGQPLKLEWKLKQKDRFFQELRVTQKPVYNIQGIPFATLLEYVVVSSFEVEKAGPNGLEIRQRVEGAELVQADPLTQPLLAPAVLKLPGTTFTMQLDAKMDVKKFEAAGLPGAVMAQADLGLQVASLLDQDGWKEMARTTFFQPNRPLKAGEKWSQPMTHAWGALGSWSGRIHYAYGGGKGRLHQFAYGLELNYQAPKAGAAGLGLRVSNAAFQAQQAGGAILFDAERGKVTEARERFLVRGRLTLQLLGQNTPVELEEDQLFHLRILETNPMKNKDRGN